VNAFLQEDKGFNENQRVKRVGMVIEIKQEHIEEYKRLHAGPGVRLLLNQANIHNFSIYLQQLEGRFYEFAYYEYIGMDYESDMTWLNAQPAYKKWLALCDPMQIPLPGEIGWTIMESVYFNE
jgi:L-rhamnose mutarotase